MIILDYSQFVIASICVNYNVNIDENYIRHVLLNSIRSHVVKFRPKYGNEIVIACDNRNYWRKDIFPYYKAKRKKEQNKSIFDWDFIFKLASEIKEEYKEYLPYNVIDVDKCEADDVVYSLVKWTQENGLIKEGLFETKLPVLIISKDEDFIQLQKYDNVSQFSQLKKSFLKPKLNPEKDLYEKIIRGDSGDSIPNIFSDEDVFICANKRQKSIYANKIEKWLDMKPEEFCDEKSINRYELNKKLIDLDCLPEELYTNIIDEYKKPHNKNKNSLLNYMVKYKMKNLLSDIGDF